MPFLIKGAAHPNISQNNGTALPKTDNYYIMPEPELIHMGQILQDVKKVLEMSVTYLHTKSRQAQTVGPGTLSF